MARMSLKTIAIAGLLGCAAMPAAALAQDTTCRNGLFTKGDGFRQAQVTAKRAFFHEDTSGCPQEGTCRTRSYVIEGDSLVIGRSMGGFVCAFFPNDAGGTAGWIEASRLRILPTSALALGRRVERWRKRRCDDPDGEWSRHHHGRSVLASPARRKRVDFDPYRRGRRPDRDHRQPRNLRGRQPVRAGADAAGRFPANRGQSPLRRGKCDLQRGVYAHRLARQLHRTRQGIAADRISAANAPDIIWISSASADAMKAAFPSGEISIRPCYIRNTPNCGRSAIGASRQAAKASPRTSRVCTGSITPSSHRRAVA